MAKSVFSQIIQRDLYGGISLNAIRLPFLAVARRVQQAMERIAAFQVVWMFSKHLRVG